jgi:homogentisate 1,2-dioxygenase
MHHYTQGDPTRQGHKGIPEGHFEEEQGLKGFFGPVSHLIHKKPTTRWVKIEGELKPRLFDLVQPGAFDLNHGGGKRLFFNQFMSVHWVWRLPVANDELVAMRNADGDTLYFCHQGSGEILTDYGLLPYKRGHYIMVPKCITHAIRPSEKSLFLTIENRASHYEEPERGMVGRHAVYDINALGKPDLAALHATIEKNKLNVTEVEIKHNDELTKYIYDDNIFDVVGWKGDLFPFTLHVDHMMPITSHRAHLPPSAHTTFVARDFVVCTFLPRPLESDSDALKVPFYHQNIDYDEILFYHDGNFFSRDNLHAGMMSFHPAGFSHGPHPKAMKAVTTKTHTDEYAVMIDSRFPLKRDPIMSDIEVKDYWKSWGAK